MVSVSGAKRVSFDDNGDTKTGSIVSVGIDNGRIVVSVKDNEEIFSFDFEGKEAIWEEYAPGITEEVKKLKESLTNGAASGSGTVTGSRSRASQS